MALVFVLWLAVLLSAVAFDMREDGEFLYRNIELGEGSYTLYAGEDGDGTLMYGMADEAAKLNINNVEAAVLEKLPGMDGETAAAIAALREEYPFHDIEDLLLIEGLDRVTLYGEDQNRNGILDPNEDDGDRSWPRDDSDGMLDGGLAEYLTTWSVSRELTADGEDRIDISSASAEAISNAIDDISPQ